MRRRARAAAWPTAPGARRKTDGKWPPHTASGRPPADACGVALRATGPFSVRCTTASLKRAPAGAGRSRDRLKSRPQLLRGVRMAGHASSEVPASGSRIRDRPSRFSRPSPSAGRGAGPRGRGINFFFTRSPARRAKGAPRRHQAPAPAVHALRGRSPPGRAPRRGGADHAVRPRGASLGARCTRAAARGPVHCCVRLCVRAHTCPSPPVCYLSFSFLSTRALDREREIFSNRSTSRNPTLAREDAMR